MLLKVQILYWIFITNKWVVDWFALEIVGKRVKIEKLKISS